MIQVQVPVTVGGIVVYPGDLLHGDLNGVTTIPHEIASEVPGACKELMAAEYIILQYLKNPSPTPQGFGEARKACGAEIQKLGKRLRGET
jgi:regulator of RNase E activity RraA